MESNSFSVFFPVKYKNGVGMSNTAHVQRLASSLKSHPCLFSQENILKYKCVTMILL